MICLKILSLVTHLIICLSEDCWLSAIFFRASSSFAAMNLSWKTQGRKIRMLRIPVEKLTHLDKKIKTRQEGPFTYAVRVNMSNTISPSPETSFVPKKARPAMTPGPRMKPSVWNKEKSAMWVVLSERSVAAAT